MRQRSFSRTITCSLIPLMVWPFGSVLARDFTPVDGGQPTTLTPQSAQVMQAMLKAMGLELPSDQRVIDPPAPGPAPVPAPQPQPEPPVNNEDDFFDDDFDDEKGFDDAVAAMDDAFDETVSNWDEEYEKTVALWEKAREEYQANKAQYAGGTIPLQASNDLQAGRAGRYQANLSAMQPGEFHLIPNAMNIAIKNQAARGTCTAFAGVRAIETIMAQHSVITDFSEQHFYFLSKPKCMSTPCNKSQEGSSLEAGLLGTRASRTALVPEPACPYTPVRDDNNITNSPLRGCAADGAIRAGQISAIRNTQSLLNALRNNVPVLAGFTLTKTYYENRGLVKQHDPMNATAPTGPDAGGHANLIIGYIKLPASESREGSYCLISANSWKIGWGRGGYACLTQAWIEGNNAQFTALQSVAMTETGLKLYGL